MELELTEKSTMLREDAAARLHAIADELASGNDIILERGQARFVAKVPAEVALKIEFEVEDDGHRVRDRVDLVATSATVLRPMSGVRESEQSVLS